MLPVFCLPFPLKHSDRDALAADLKAMLDPFPRRQ